MQLTDEKQAKIRDFVQSDYWPVFLEVLKYCQENNKEACATNKEDVRFYQGMYAAIYSLRRFFELVKENRKSLATHMVRYPMYDYTRDV